MEAPRYFIYNSLSDTSLHAKGFCFLKIEDWRTTYVYKDESFDSGYRPSDLLNSKDWTELPIEEIALKFGRT